MTPSPVPKKPESLIISDLKWRYLTRSIVKGKKILLTGPSGCGKTFAAQSAAQSFPDRPFHYFNLGATQDARSTLIGNTHFDKKNGTYVSEALFVNAIQQPNAILLLDELTRGNFDAWNILMTVLDENQSYLRIDERPDTPTIHVADGVSFIATANVGMEYTGTKVLDRAILDRFSVIIDMEPLSEEDEKTLLRKKFPEAKPEHIDAVAAIVSYTRKDVASDSPRLSTALSSRMSSEMMSLLQDGFTLAEIADVCVYPFYSADGGSLMSERTYMKQVIQAYL